MEKITPRLKLPGHVVTLVYSETHHHYLPAFVDSVHIYLLVSTFQLGLT